MNRSNGVVTGCIYFLAVPNENDNRKWLLRRKLVRVLTYLDHHDHWCDEHTGHIQLCTATETFVRVCRERERELRKHVCLQLLPTSGKVIIN